jgi:eukaryotic-like serine/threonine-protein kinase
VVKVPSSDKVGIVVSSNPQFGTKVAPHSNVTLRVSAGPKKVTIPNVVGASESAAQSQLQGLGLNVTTKTAPNSTLPQGKVARTDPPVGTQVKQGSTVVLFVSGGGTQVPSVIGDPKATAESILSNAGFQVKVVTAAGPAGSAPGTVFQQQPSNGTTAASGSTVTIFVAAATQPTSAPTSASPTPTAPSTPTPTPSATSPGGGGGNSGGTGNGRR